MSVSRKSRAAKPRAAKMPKIKCLPRDPGQFLKQSQNQQPSHRCSAAKCLAAKNNISVLNTPGTIDSDYRGEIKVILFNHGDKDFTVNNDDRIAQMILMPILKVDFETVETLPETIRGSGGFGSTGK